MKYRRLTATELKALRTEFIRFLAANSIPASDWEQLKTTHPAKAEKLIGVFSDTVLGKVYEKVDFLLLVRPEEVFAFKMESEAAVMYGVRFEKKVPSLTDDRNLDKIFSDPSRFLSYCPMVFTTGKKYEKSKPEEVYLLVSRGAVSTDKKWFEFLSGLKSCKT